MKRITVTIAVIGAAFRFASAVAQSDAFETRLAPVPIDARTQAEVTGKGHATARLDGRRLTITGGFDGLQAPASAAQLHLSVVTGVRGPAIHDLEVTHATAGSLDASIELSAREVEALRAGLLYVQIDGENLPEGNLWGWFVE